MNMIKTIISNGFVLLIPIFIWNAVVTKKLPESFDADIMDAGMPKLILIAENLLRMIVFLSPILFKIDISTKMGSIGFALYIVGLLIYFASWLAVILIPETMWSKSVFGYAAPAYTTIVWFVGICFMIKSYYLNIPYAAWHYLTASTLFVGVHTLHSVLAFAKIK